MLGADGAPVEDVTRSHQAWMHFIVTRDDLATFAHLHPEPTGQPGELAVDVAFPTPGRYLIHTEFRRQGQMNDILSRDEVTVAGPPAPTAVPIPDSVPTSLGGTSSGRSAL